MKPLEWFKLKVNTRIFRDDSGCKCHHCADAVKNGIIVQSEGHAEYLYWNQNEFANDNVLLNYRDTLETTP